MLGILIIVAGLAVGQPDAAAQPDIESQVARHVRRLGADTLADREAAEQALLELGLPAIEFLPVPNPRMSTEQRTRLKRIGDQLRSQQAAAATTGSTVTLDLEDVKLAEALQAIEKQTGNQIVDYREQMGQDVTDVSVSLQLDGAPFWEAVDQILKQTSMTVYSYASDDDGNPLPRIALVAESPSGKWGQDFVAYDGAFRFEALSIRSRRGLRDADESRLQLDLEAAWEPKIAPISLHFDLNQVEATLDDGETILKSPAPGRQSLDVFGRSTQFPVFLTLAPAGAKKITSIRGTLSAILPGRIETFRFERLNKVGDEGVRQKQGDVTVILEAVRKNQTVWDIRLRAEYADDAGGLESHLEGWVASNEIYLETPDGKARKDVDAVDDPDAVATSGAGFIFVLPEGQDISDYHLVYKTPAALVKQDVHFELQDIPLP